MNSGVYLVMWHTHNRRCASKKPELPIIIHTMNSAVYLDMWHTHNKRCVYKLIIHTMNSGVYLDMWHTHNIAYRVVTVASLQQFKMEALIPAPADCEVQSVIKFLNAQSIAPIEIHHTGLVFGEFRV